MSDFAAGWLTGWLFIIVWAVGGVLTNNVKFEWWRGDKRKSGTAGKADSE